MPKVTFFRRKKKGTEVRRPYGRVNVEARATVVLEAAAVQSKWD
ncbi:hypothetical protein ES332_A12G107300v1 [Gossypium tomentosum]|uniref:Uncharacterized protein n=1 Tax=Gossypium tomentosum TaxID=34277 RepID=A0A5D2MV89_GOSTO|nr:hypothetical protein ES332_A12G107300v1 [Gossypium tomentosum]